MMSLASLQAYAMARPLDLPSRARALYLQVRSQLLAASDAGIVAESPEQILKLVQILPEPPPQIREHLRVRNLHEGAFCIVGGEKNQERDPTVAHFTRSDGGWFDFTITVRERSRQLELLAYDFELRFPPAQGSPFLRFDLNLPGHENEERDLRCHLHPGTDDLQVPAPLMKPSELLALFLEGTRLSSDRAPRVLTTFECLWFEETYTHVRR